MPNAEIGVARSESVMSVKDYNLSQAIERGLEAPEEFHARIGERIRLLRTSFNIRVADLARLLGVSYQQVQKYEAGINQISTDRLWRLAQLFNVTLDFIVEPDKQNLIDLMNARLQAKICKDAGS